MNHSRSAEEMPALLRNLFLLLEAHRPVFKQERVHRRAVALVLAEIFAFGRHTITQLLLALGVVAEDWSAWYRLFSCGRFVEEKAAEVLLAAVKPLVAEDGLFVTGCDGFQVSRTSQKMPGSSWLKALGTAPFKPGIHRAQRFLEGSWFTPLEHGFSRAIPLRCLAAFPPKAVGGAEGSLKEWQAGLLYLQWLRGALDRLERAGQQILVLADGAFDTQGMWAGLPERVLLVVRTARNRALYELPQRPGKRGRGAPRKYGDKAPAPAEWLKDRKGFRHRQVLVRGRLRSMRYRIQGPYLRDGLPHIPLFLIVIGGGKRPRGSRRQRYYPCFYLVSAVRQGSCWQLPLPESELLAWLWQRWELEVCHREMKSALGLGEKQCWNPTSAVLTVQWSVWVYAILVLAGYQTWGLLQGPAPLGAWRKKGRQRWSFTTLWRGYRAVLWQRSALQACWSPTPDNWLKIEALEAALNNAVIAMNRA